MGDGKVGSGYAGTGYAGLRVPPRPAREPKTYDVDPEAVARLKRILAEKEAAEIEKKVRRLEERQARKAAQSVKKSKAIDEANEEEDVSTKGTGMDVTDERVAQWAAWRREGKSYDYITRHDELRPSYYVIKDRLKKAGYTFAGKRRKAGEPAYGPLVTEVKQGPAKAAVKAEAVEAAPAPAATAAGVALAPARDQQATGMEAQLAAVERLLAQVRSGDVKVSGRLTIDLNIEIGF